LAFAVLLGLTARARGQVESTPAPKSEGAVEAPVGPTKAVDPHERVRAGNALLEEGKAAEALQAYDAAAQERPDAAEIAFDRGLSHYRLGQYEEARRAFEHARLSARRSVQERAQYAYGACDHAEALTLKEPKAILAKLESAMRQYQDVLAQHADEDFPPDAESAFLDEAVRDAHFKAGTTWRAIKEMLEQQQEEQEQSQDSDNPQEQQSEQKEQQQQEQEQQSEQDQQSQAQEQQDEQQAQAESGQQDDQQDQQQASAATPQQQEQASREQALRQLRRLMDRQRQRQEQRQEALPPPSARPVEKDW